MSVTGPMCEECGHIEETHVEDGGGCTAEVLVDGELQECLCAVFVKPKLASKPTGEKMAAAELKYPEGLTHLERAHYRHGWMDAMNAKGVRKVKVLPDPQAFLEAFNAGVASQSSLVERVKSLEAMVGRYRKALGKITEYRPPSQYSIFSSVQFCVSELVKIASAALSAEQGLDPDKN